MRAVEYISYSDASGYGIAAAGYVRLLVDAGFLVHWMPYSNDALWDGRVGPEHAKIELSRGRASLIARGMAGAESRMQALVDATSRPVDARIRIIHLLPSFWPQHLSPMPGVRHIGVTAWETDRITSKWLPALQRMDHLCVPSEHNAGVLRAAPASLPGVSVVPHLCRDTLHPPPPPRLAGLAKFLGIRANDTVFYTINAWDPRKRLAALIDGFVRNFHAEDKAVLVVKTSQFALFDDPASPVRDRMVSRMARAIIERTAAEIGRPPPRITIIADNELADNIIDGLHTLGDCYVSLSRCEGFGLGGFDAAAHGKPVVAVGYAGPLDYLGENWLGRVPHQMVPTEDVPEYGWFEAGQNWPEPDDATAFALMRRFVADPAPFLAEATAKAPDIQVKFGTRSVSERLLAALDQVG